MNIQKPRPVLSSLPCLVRVMLLNLQLLKVYYWARILLWRPYMKVHLTKSPFAIQDTRLHVFHSTTKPLLLEQSFEASCESKTNHLLTLSSSYRHMFEWIDQINLTWGSNGANVIHTNDNISPVHPFTGSWSSEDWISLHTPSEKLFVKHTKDAAMPFNYTTVKWSHKFVWLNLQIGSPCR